MDRQALTDRDIERIVKCFEGSPEGSAPAWKRLRSCRDQARIGALLDRVAPERATLHAEEFREIVGRCLHPEPLRRHARIPDEDDLRSWEWRSRRIAIERLVEIESLEGLDPDDRRMAEDWLLGEPDWHGIPKRQRWRFGFGRSVAAVTKSERSSKHDHGSFSVETSIQRTTYDLSDVHDFGVFVPRSEARLCLAACIAAPLIGALAGGGLIWKLSEAANLGEVALFGTVGAVLLLAIPIAFMTSSTGSMLDSRARELHDGAEYPEVVRHADYNAWLGKLERLEHCRPDLYQREFRALFLPPIVGARIQDDLVRQVASTETP